MLAGRWEPRRRAGISAELRIARLYRITRQSVALVAILAVLLQAILFAWHHHALPFRARATAAVTTLAAPTSPAIPASADQDCQICFSLCHHGVLPVDFFGAKPPEEKSLRQVPAVAVDVPLVPYLLFRSRAPPRPEILSA